MIKPELAFAIIMMSNFAGSDRGFYRWVHVAALVEDIAFFGGDLGRSVSIRMRQNDVQATYRTVDGSYEGLDQFLVVVAILLQQLAILMTYVAWYVCREFVKRRRASRREAKPF
ncbi:hypothetical protein [Rhizobium bangladeshense]|uniref:hypothetical protein n=1 Tax=Rhizobium bangladeshense TaxID=1138189 RepID=UPI002180B8FF|nr:hypothetical protein [Rhizobium bangladeshense]